ncbi:MAG: T9SS type A sorting domain-containing protein, partial [Chitinophagales bacterium]
VYITTSCSVGATGYSPGPGDPLLGLGGVWVCSPGCNFGGLWTPTIDDGSTASLVACNTPVCGSYGIDFTIHHNQYQCVTAGACVATCDYLQKFQVTVEGETVTLTALAEGATSYTVVNCADQSGWLSVSTPNYGVPPYSYSWSPLGVFGSPIYTPWPMGVTNYTCTITDACGNTAVDVVTVTNNCLVLPIELLSFSGYHADDVNFLNWETGTETNNDVFVIERSATGLNFEPIGTIDGNGTTLNLNYYAFTDRQPFEGINYYRLKQVDEDEEYSYSNVISIKSSELSSTEIIVNNDGLGGSLLELTIFSTGSGLADLIIYDVTGKQISTNKVTVGNGATSVNLQLPDLAKGAYIVSFSRESEKAQAKFIR